MVLGGCRSFHVLVTTDWIGLKEVSVVDST